MMLALALFAALTSILSTPHAEPAAFVDSVLMHCEPVVSATFVGCEHQTLDERDYAGWSHIGPVAGP